MRAGNTYRIFYPQVSWFPNPKFLRRIIPRREESVHDKEKRILSLKYKVILSLKYKVIILEIMGFSSLKSRGDSDD